MQLIFKVKHYLKLKDMLFIALALCLLGLHFYNITADPSILKSTEDIHDEAWWAENARQKILFHRWTADGIAGALAAGPLTVAWHYMIFSIGGINFFTLRLISLIPFSVLILALLYRCSVRSKKEGNTLMLQNTILLLLCLPLLFDWTRLGHPEILMSCLGLASFVLGRREGRYNLIISGFIAALALFVKGAFVYHFLAIALVLAGTNAKQFFRRGLLFSCGASLVVIPFWMGYYMPNAAFFETYQSQFAGAYYTWQQLLHPAGIALRLVHLAEKPFMNDPVSSIMIAVVLFRFLCGKTPHDKFSYSTLLGFCFLFALGSDFSPRRFVFPMLLLPFAFTEPLVERKINWWQNGIIISIISLCIFNHFWPTSWAAWSASGGQLAYNDFLWIGLTAHALTGLGFSYCALFFQNTKGHKELIWALPIVLWWLFLQVKASTRIFNNSIHPYILAGVITAGALCLLYIILSKKLHSEAIILVSCLWLTVVLDNTKDATYKTAKSFAEISNSGEYAIGSNLPCTATFLSKVSPAFNPQSEHYLKARWRIELTSPERNAVKSEIFPNETLVNTLSVYSDRENLRIFKRTLH
jgi:hypothetical protein